MKKIGNFRWVICALLFAITAINYMDRQIIGLLKPALEWNSAGAKSITRTSLRHSRLRTRWARF